MEITDLFKGQKVWVNGMSAIICGIDLNQPKKKVVIKFFDSDNKIKSRNVSPKSIQPFYSLEERIKFQNSDRRFVSGRVNEQPFDSAINSIERRFGVSFLDYIGKRTPEIQAKIDYALHLETQSIPMEAANHE